jgi:quercetin dioxygenase-like cupin family protein
MITRRHAVASLAMLAELLASGVTGADAQTPAPPPLFRQDLPMLAMEGWEVTASIVNYAPGQVGVAHRHPGFVLVYVLEGAMVARISGQGAEKTYAAGQMFYEQPGATHEVSRNASQTQPARFLAMIFAKKGSTLTVPV